MGGHFPDSPINGILSGVQRSLGRLLPKRTLRILAIGMDAAAFGSLDDAGYDVTVAGPGELMSRGSAAGPFDAVIDALPAGCSPHGDDRFYRFWREAVCAGGIASALFYGGCPDEMMTYRQRLLAEFAGWRIEAGCGTSDAHAGWVAFRKPPAAV